jgi:hypothetical protein
MTGGVGAVRRAGGEEDEGCANAGTAKVEAAVKQSAVCTTEITPF